MDKMREEFEAFVINRMKESGFLEVEVRVEMLGVSSDGSYFDGTVDAWWYFWQASRAALRVELPKITDFAKDYRGAREVLNFEFAVECVARELNDVGVSYE